MATHARISVSLVTYHSDLARVSATIESLRASTVAHELLVIDNSQDDRYFAALIDATHATCMRSPRNGGFGFGHNFALEQIAQAVPYHLVLNPDVTIHPGCLETLVAAMEADATIGLTVPKILYPDGRLQALNKNDPTLLDIALRQLPRFMQQWAPIRRRMARFVRMDVGYETRSDVPFASGCFMLFRRNVLEQIGRFDERYFMYFEDADISRRARAIARNVFIPQAVITHDWARGHRSNMRLLGYTLRSAFTYFRRWGWKLF